MQLGKYLEAGGADKVNVVAINWTEERYGGVNETRLNRMVQSFHPSIRVIKANEAIEKDFAPLVYVPINFLFDPRGNLVFGDGKRGNLAPKELDRLIAGMS